VHARNGIAPLKFDEVNLLQLATIETDGNCQQIGTAEAKSIAENIFATEKMACLAR
jgi:hypothetical protein